jgi:N-acetylglucosamine-6-sulfatase
LGNVNHNAANINNRRTGTRNMHSRRDFLKTAGLGAAAVLMPRISRAAKAVDKPNILFIMSDDHTYQAIGAYGSRLAKLNPTPVIDTLAKEGMLFENAFCTNSICTPSRASIITGQYSIKNGVLDLGGNIAPENQYLAIEMRKAGYCTAMVGKWHLKKEPNFDYYSVLPGQGKYHDPIFREKADGKAFGKNVVKKKGHSSDCITDITLNWFKNIRDKSKPFFLMHHYKAPHDFFDHAKRYDNYLEDVNIPEPENLWKQPKFGSIATRGHNDELLPYIGTSIGRRNLRRNYTKSWARDSSLSDEQAKRLAYNVYLKKYLRCVKGVDDNLKRLFAYLRKEGLMDNTVIIYTGDQGFMLGEHDYMDKRWMYDESHRMPFLIRYPKTIKAGSRSDAIVENVDYGPTMLDFAGIKTPDCMQGGSFKSICESGKEPGGWKQAAYYRYWMHMAHHDNPSHFGIRTKKFKLIFYYGCSSNGGNQTPPGWELYDLSKDPKEVNNVYDNPEYAKIVSELKGQLAALRKKYGDTDERFPAMKKVVDEFWDYGPAARKRAIEISHEMLERKKKAPVRRRRNKKK